MRGDGLVPPFTREQRDDGRQLLEPPRRPRGRPPNPTPRRGGVRITPQERETVRQLLAQLAAQAAAGNGDASAQCRAVRRLLQSWENRQRHSGRDC